MHKCIFELISKEMNNLKATIWKKKKRRQTSEAVCVTKEILRQGEG